MYRHEPTVGTGERLVAAVRSIVLTVVALTTAGATRTVGTTERFGPERSTSTPSPAVGDADHAATPRGGVVA